MTKLESCDICGSKDYEIILTENGLNVIRCNNCGFIYSQYIPERIFERSETAEEIFRLTEKKRKVFYQVLDQLKKGKLLDVGCRTGNFMLHAKSRGFECHGIEISSRFVSFCQKKGLNVYNSTLMKSDFPDQLFDVITYLEVLEHISKPSEECLEAYRVLKNDGLIVLEVPNVRFQLFKAKILGVAHYGLMPNDHLVHFSEKTIRSLLEKTGFKVQKTMCRTIYIPDNEPFVFKLLLLFNYYISKVVKRIFGVNISNAMIVIAKKCKKD